MKGIVRPKKIKDHFFDYGVLLLLLLYNNTYTVIHHLFSNNKGFLGVIGYLLFALAVLSIFRRIKRVPNRIWGVIFVLALAIIYSCFYESNIIYLQSIFSLVKLRSVWILFLLASIVSHPDELLVGLRMIAYPIILLNVYGVFNGAYSDDITGRFTLYMGFSYQILIWIAIIMQYLFTESASAVSRAINTAFAVFSCFMLAFYGSRGAVLSLLVFIAFCFLKYFKRSKKALFATFFSLLGLIVYLFWDFLFLGFIYATQKIGITSRNLYLLQSSLLSSDTNRSETVYKFSYDLIKAHPIIGSGIGADRVAGGGTEYYAHNIILELCVDFGVIIGIVILVWIVLRGIKMLKDCNDNDWIKLFAPYYVTSIIHLFVSSSVYISPEFWIAVGIYYACRASIRRKGGRL